MGKDKKGEQKNEKCSSYLREKMLGAFPSLLKMLQSNETAELFVLMRVK